MEETISDRLERLERDARDNEGRQGRSFQMPIAARLSRGKVMKKEWVHVWMIKQNKSVEITTKKVEDGTVKVGDYFYDARAANILRWKNRPILILKEWTTEPETPVPPKEFDPEKEYEIAAKSGKLTASQKLILTKLKMEAIKPKMNFNFMTLIVIAAVLIGGYYALTYVGVL